MASNTLTTTVRLVTNVYIKNRTGQACERTPIPNNDVSLPRLENQEEKKERENLLCKQGLSLLLRLIIIIKLSVPFLYSSL